MGFEPATMGSPSNTVPPAPIIDFSNSELKFIIILRASSAHLMISHSTLYCQGTVYRESTVLGVLYCQGTVYCESTVLGVLYCQGTVYCESTVPGVLYCQGTVYCEGTVLGVLYCQGTGMTLMYSRHLTFAFSRSHPPAKFYERN